MKHSLVLLLISFSLGVGACSSLQRSAESGYQGQRTEETVVRYGNDQRLNSDAKQIAYELGYDPTAQMSSEQINAVYDRKQVKELERSLNTSKEKEQYSKVLPWFQSDKEKIEFLRIPSLEGRQQWINTRRVWDRAARPANQMKEIVDANDIAVGMPMDLVRKSWGEPQSVEVSGNPVYRNERWKYLRSISSSDGFRQERRVVYFEGGRVVGWETE